MRLRLRLKKLTSLRTVEARAIAQSKSVKGRKLSDLQDNMCGLRCLDSGGLLISIFALFMQLKDLEAKRVSII